MEVITTILSKEIPEMALTIFASSGGTVNKEKP
jgi:hypothetical protein